MSGQGSSVMMRASTTATTPFTMSSSITVMPTGLPSVRKTLVAPTLRLPTVRMSMPRARPARYPNGIEPRR